MAKHGRKRKSNNMGDDNNDEVSMCFPNPFIHTREFMMMTVDAGSSSITTTKHVTTTYKPQMPPVSIDEMPTQCPKDKETSPPVDGTQARLFLNQGFTAINEHILAPVFCLLLTI